MPAGYNGYAAVAVHAAASQKNVCAVWSGAILEIVGEVARFGAKSICEFQDGRQSRLAAASLDPPDAGQVDAGRVRQPVLREAFSRS